MLYGITDIGSNTVRLNVYRQDNEHISLLFSKKYMLGLVFYIKKGKLSQKGIGKLVSVLKEMKDDLDYLKIEEYHFFATAVLRNIENQEEVMEIIKDQLNIEIDLLSGEEEGRLSFCGSSSLLKEDDGILIDSGGGSVEIVIFKDRKIMENYSIRVGSLKMYNEYVSKLIPNRKESKSIKEKVNTELEKIHPKKVEIPFMCGIGGSIRTINKLMVDLNLKKKKSDVIEAKLLGQLEKELSHDVKDTVDKILHVKPSRIHTLIPTLLVLEAITSYFGCEEVQISKYSVREGYLFKKVLNRCQHV